jgi:hypothetical protein
MEFVDSAWITAAGATVGTIAIAIVAIVFLKWHDDNVWTRRVVYVLALALVASAIFLNFQERKSSTTIAGEVGKTLDLCRATLDTLNGGLMAKLLVEDNAQAAHNIALSLKDTLDHSECKRP